MQGAKAYVLPLVAGLVLLTYWLLVPDVEDAPAPAPPAPDTPSKSAPADEGQGPRIAEIQAGLGEPPDELPREYRTRQLGILRGALGGCDAPDPIPFRITIIGTPGHGGAVESVEPTGDVSAELEACVHESVESLRLAAPPKAGRSVIDL